MILLESLSLLALASAPAIAPQQTERRFLEVVRGEGAWERVVPGAPGGARAWTRGQGLVTSPRWQIDDNGAAWVGDNMAVGDSGAFLLAAKRLNAQGISMHATGSAAEVFAVDAPGSQAQYVDIADRAPFAASLIVTDEDPGTGYDYEAVLETYEVYGDGTPLFSYTFPRTLNYFGGGVAISDDASRVVAWKADPNSGNLLVEAFDIAGQPISSGTISSGGNFNARQARLSDDGKRAYFFIGTDAHIYDVASATVIHTHNIGASFDSHAFSGDGTTFAYGTFGALYVYQEQSGNWNQVASQSFSGSVYVGRVALNQDGSRLGYTVQRYSPAYDHNEVGLIDVPTNTVLFSDSLDAPGTTTQLVTSGVDVDDAGERVVACSWGDSLNATPEVAAWDAAGNRLVEIDLAGSAFGLDLSPDGEVWASGSKAVHANSFGNGGSITCGDGDEQILHVLGFPEAGGTVQLQVADTWDRARVGISTQLGTSSTPIGDLDIDLNFLFRELRLVVPPGGLDQTLNVPPNPSLWGAAFHWQAVVRDTVGNQQITNKVSTRIIP